MLRSTSKCNSFSAGQPPLGKELLNRRKMSDSGLAEDEVFPAPDEEAYSSRHQRILNTAALEIVRFRPTDGHLALLRSLKQRSRQIAASRNFPWTS